MIIVFSPFIVEQKEQKGHRRRTGRRKAQKGAERRRKDGHRTRQKGPAKIACRTAQKGPIYHDRRAQSGAENLRQSGADYPHDQTPRTWVCPGPGFGILSPFYGFPLSPVFPGISAGYRPALFRWDKYGPPGYKTAFLALSPRLRFYIPAFLLPQWNG